MARKRSFWQRARLRAAYLRRILASPREAFRRFGMWRYRNMSLRRLILLSAVLVGLLGGISSVILKNLTHLIQHFVENTLVGQMGFNGFYFAFPIVGITLTLLVIRYVIRREVGHGIPNVLYSISRGKSLLPFRSTYAALITAPLTIGFGGSVGLEGPAVGTGAAVGSNFARLLNLDAKTRSLLLGCGTAAALSAIFKVPITGIIFVIEVFALDLTMASLIPLILASATGILVSYVFMGQSLTLDFRQDASFHPGNILYYVLLALFTSLASIHFTRIYSRVGKFFENCLHSRLARLLLGGLGLGCLIYLMPPLYGDGYATMNSLLAGDFTSVIDFPWAHSWTDNPWMAVVLLVVLLYLKMIATTVTFGAGGVGGTFAPTLFMGAVAGLAFAQAVNLVHPEADLSLSNFSLVGMAGMMAGVMQSPLSAVFLIAETTGGYVLIAPLMIVSALSFVITKFYTPYSVYTEELAKKGDLPGRDKDKAILREMELDELIETDFVKIPVDATLGEVVQNAVARSSRNIFPVVSPHNHLVGVVLLDDLRQVMFDPSLYTKLGVSDLMIQPPAVIDTQTDTMETIAQKFQKTGAWNLPVVGYHNRYAGFISRGRMLSTYRQKVVEMSRDAELF